MARGSGTGLALLGLLCLAAAAQAEVYLEERFDAGWDKRWHKSSWKAKEGSAGEFKLTAGKWYGDEEADKGIQTGPDSKFFSIWSELKKPFTNDKKDLVLQFSVKHEQDIDCGGGYIKLIPASSKDKMKDFGGDTPYSIMFGPDICGFGTRKTHVILPYKGKNHLIKKDIKAENDQLTHVYTLRIMPNNTYQVLIDLEQVAEGSLEDDWDMLPPRKIKDPKATKPEDWDEREKIPDPEDKKPAGWDDIPATLPDPDAKKPEDWDDEDDGEWEPPTVPNPEYKGEWKQKTIDNPAYKGKWVAPDIDNPEFKPDEKLHVIKDSKYVGFELWQVKAGSIFDNIIVTDDLAAAKKLAEETWKKNKDGEKAMFEKAKKEEDEKKKTEAKEEDDDEYDEDDDDDDEDDKKKGKKAAPSEKLDDDEDEDEKDEL
ncbi:calreticulin-like [Raphidocelis subcapitata]|uniref:Calreticulin n=1 Tax=Raphidocelis subcapitata TaxID=307507 RepID=A0A2V0PHL9_9CHLO|nr:calreticulin-like [Raphidocelis subcapitata]|eukprot:GBF99256.1 calreticulin-like [Raphidocelis subcapitata]